MADIDIEALIAQVSAATAAAVVAQFANAKADAWDRNDPTADAAREADFAAARAAKQAEIEAINAEVERRAYWANLPADELAKLEAEAAARRYAEALADTIMRKADPATVAGLADKIPAPAARAALAAVADELAESHPTVATALRGVKPR